MPTSICTIRFQIRTILFAFRRVRVCVCFLVSHPCETMGTHAKASLPCLPLPLHRLSPFPQPLQKDNTPSPRTTTLASLVKGEVLSPDKIRATTGGIATPLFLALHQPLQNRTIPPAFRTAIVCVCLYDFAFELSHSLFVGEWACPSRCTNPCCFR